MIRALVVGVGVALLLAPAAQAAHSYQLDVGHSHVGFSVRHFAVSSVRGQFKHFSAELLIDEENPVASSVKLRIEAASIFTDHDQRDEHLRSADFLDVANHPDIVFKSKKIAKRADQGYLVTGDLTIRGVTREIEMPVTLAGPIQDPLGLMRMGVEGELIINRQEYGVSWSKVMDNGGLFVGNEVKIAFSIEATRAPAKVAPAGQ